MRRPQVVVFERDGRLARQLDAFVGEKKWVLRESRQPDACVRLLAGQGPSVLVVRVPSAADTEMTLLSRISESLPHVSTIAVGDTDNAVGTSALAWDLDVDFALFPPVSPARLPAIVEGLMGHS